MGFGAGRVRHAPPHGRRLLRSSVRYRSHAAQAGKQTDPEIHSAAVIGEMMGSVASRHLLALLLTLTASAAGAEESPQFRGPTGEGHSAERGVPLEWSETRNVLWKTPVTGSG